VIAVVTHLLVCAHRADAAFHAARAAALCLQQGVKTLWTADRDFTRFAPLRALNPLVAVASRPG